MSEDQSTPAISSRHEPSEIRPRHEAPPIPQFHQPPPVPEFHEPPAVPDAALTKTKDYQPRTVDGDREKVLFVVEKSSSRASPHIPVVIDRGSAASEPGTFLPWVAIILALLSAPCILAAAVSEMGEKWIPLGVALMASFTAASLGRYAKERGGKSLAFARLSFQLGFGFLIISCVATIAALIQDAAELKRLTERIYDLARKFHDLAASVWAYFTHLFGHSPPPSPSPSPMPVP